MASPPILTDDLFKAKDNSLVNHISLLSLPEEILIHIFSLLFPQSHAAKGCHSFWTSSQRVYNLVKALRWRSIQLYTTESLPRGVYRSYDVDALEIFDRTELHPLIQYLKFDITFSNSNRFPARILPLLSNLKSLYLGAYYRLEDTADPLLPTYFLDNLSLLRGLSHLYLTTPFPADLVLDLDTDLPHLTHLSTGWNVELELTSPGSLTHLSFELLEREESYALLAIALPQLLELRIIQDSKSAITLASRWDFYSCSRLKTLTIENQSYSSTSDSNFGQLRHFLENLAKSSISKLSIHFEAALEGVWEREESAVLPNMKDLQLSIFYSPNFDEVPDRIYRNLAKFLYSFPNLVCLELGLHQNLDPIPDNFKDDLKSWKHLDHLDFCVQFPISHAFLDFVRGGTKIETIYIMINADSDPVTIKCSRTPSGFRREFVEVFDNDAWYELFETL